VLRESWLGRRLAGSSLHTGGRWLVLIVASVTILAGAVVAIDAVGASSAQARSVHGKKKHKKPKPLTYTVRFEIDSLRYWSNRSYPGVKENEQDYSKSGEMAASAAYKGLTVPRQGEATKSEHKASHQEVSVPFENYGSSTDPPTSYDCKGHLATDGTQIPVLRAQPAKVNGHDDVALEIEVAQRYKIEGASGDFAPPSSCAQQFDDKTAFVPASQHYMPAMLTASLKVKLSELRGLKVGESKQAAGLTSERHALKDPPSDCTIFSISCTQHLDWKGRVVFTRTS
jgi:hypothetical protein